jgi:UDP-N-acetylenolpyruvoylglucosamine reductase
LVPDELNEGGASGHDISTLSVKVRKAVFETFGVHLEPEPLLVDFQN